MKLKLVALALAVMAAILTMLSGEPAHAGPAAVLTVTLAGDYIPDECQPQSCLLREAILDSNATIGVQETIKFNIPGNSSNCNANTGVCTIKLLGTLPDITDPVIIDGYSQPGAHPNTLSVGNDAAFKIVLDGTGLGIENGLHVTGGSSTIQGLVVQNFSYGINLESNGNTVAGNFLGTDVAGNTSKANFVGLSVIGQNNTIGGTTPDARNLVSGNETWGVYLKSGFKNRVVGNYVGTNRDGLSAVPNRIGIYIEGSSQNTIGGKGVDARNVVSGNHEVGILFLFDSSDNVTKNNYIGLAANKTALGNGSEGIWFFGQGQFVSSSNTVSKNRISNNGSAGIKLGHEAANLSVDNTFTRNVIHGNGGLGIDIFPYDQSNANDKRDADDGPNHLQNYPALKQVNSENGKTTITGVLKSAPKKTYRIEFFTNNPCQDSGHGEGEKYFGTTTVTTNKKGVAQFTFTKNKTLAAGTALTATATQIVNGIPGSTSEFSACHAAQ